VSSDKNSEGSILERAARRLEKAIAATPAPGREETIKRQIYPPAPAQMATPAPADAMSTPQEPGASRHSRRGEIDLVSLRENGYIVPDSPSTLTAEEFRLIKRTLLLNAFAREGTTSAIRNGNLILVCSSQPNEGKTFCAINLALSIASEPDLTVMLVDADFAKPEILSTLGLEGGKGLIDVIADPSLDLADCLIRTNIENFSVLPAGRQHHLTTELLASERMGMMIEEIAKRYSDRVVIFDSPPALASSAASVLALHVGQSLFVVEAENTNETQLKEALSMVSACPNIHLLLNKTRFNTGARKFGTYYGYGA
jgi:protein-tyrosine kinase